MCLFVRTADYVPFVVCQLKMLRSRLFRIVVRYMTAALCCLIIAMLCTKTTTVNRFEPTSSEDYQSVQIRPRLDNQQHSGTMEKSRSSDRPELLTQDELGGQNRWTPVVKSLARQPDSSSVIDGLHLCSGIRRPGVDEIVMRRGVWQVQTVQGDDEGEGETPASTAAIDEIVMHSAFYDDRPVTLHESPMIRINAVRPAKYESRQLVCYLWYSAFDSPVISAAVVTKAGGAGHVVTGRRILYAQYLYSCPLSTSQSIPSHVSIVGGSSSSSDRCTNATAMLRIRRRPPSATTIVKHQFATCTETSFGNVRPETIVEWIEANRMFGVTLFNIYDGALTNGATRYVLQRYAARGIVRLTSLPPAIDDDSIEGIKLSSPTSFNDCLMTNMHTTRFLIVLDFDELIVPRSRRSGRRLANYSSMIEYVDRRLKLPPGGYHSYAFRNTYFFTFYPADDRQPAHLKTMRYRYRAPPDDFMFVPKSFVDPTRCLALFNHYCLHRLPGADSSGRGVAIDVPMDIGRSHHYRRSCELKGRTCDEYEKLKAVDDVMLAYRQTLETRVNRTMEELGIGLHTAV